MNISTPTGRGARTRSGKNKAAKNNNTDTSKSNASTVTATTSSVRASVVSTTLVSVETFSTDAVMSTKSADDFEAKKKFEGEGQVKPTDISGRFFFFFILFLTFCCNWHLLVIAGYKH